MRLRHIADCDLGIVLVAIDTCQRHVPTLCGIALRYDGIVSRGFDTALSEKSLLFLGGWYFKRWGWYFMGCEGFVV